MTSAPPPPETLPYEALLLRFLAVFLAHLMLLPPLAVAAMALGRIQHPAADLMVQFSAFAFFVALGLALASLLLRLTPAAVSGFVVCGLLLWANAPQWFPPKAAVAPGSGSLSVYSANLWVYNDDLEALSRSIKAADADILILVEFGLTAREADDRLFANYPYRLYAGRGDHPAKSVIVSRYPLERINGDKHPETVAAVAKTPLGPVSLIGAHLTRPWPYQPPEKQIRQVDRLTGLRSQIDGPLIMAGDFNAVSHGRIGRRIKKDMGLVPAPAFPGTFPSKLPSPIGLTIDHVWHTDDLALTSRKLGLKNGSDHRPVVTRFSRAARSEP